MDSQVSEINANLSVELKENEREKTEGKENLIVAVTEVET